MATGLTVTWFLCRPIAPIEEAYRLGYEAGLREGLRQASPGRRVVGLPTRGQTPSSN